MTQERPDPRFEQLRSELESVRRATNEFEDFRRRLELIEGGRAVIGAYDEGSYLGKVSEINAVGTGVTASRLGPRLKLDIPGSDSGLVGAAGLFEYDYVIDPAYTGVSGTAVTLGSGGTCRIYVTIAAASAHAAALAVGSRRSFFIMRGSYNEQVAATPPNSGHWLIDGAVHGTSWATNGNGQTLLNLGTMTSCYVRIRGIRFDLGSNTTCTGVTSANGLIDFGDCHFDTGGATSSIGIACSNTLRLGADSCTFDGSGTGFKATTAQVATFSNCDFKSAVGLDITGNRIQVPGSTFSCTTSDIILRGTAAEVTLTGSEFNKGLTTTGSASCDNFACTGCSFRLGAGEFGLDFAGLTVNSEAFDISSNTFSGASTAVGIRLDANMIEGLVAANAFQGFSAGNSISGTGGADLQGFHNSSDIEALADFGPVVGHNAAGTIDHDTLINVSDDDHLTDWVNTSGSALSAGAVVIAVPDSNDFITTTNVGSLFVIGITAETIADTAAGKIRHAGYAAAVAVTGAVATGDYLRTSSTGALAVSMGATVGAGAFAIALSVAAGGACEAYLFPVITATTATGGQLERTFALGVAGSIPVATAQFADFPFILPHAGTLLRMKAAVKVAVAADKTIRLRKATLAGGYTDWTDVGAFVLTLTSGTNGGFYRDVDPANIAAAEGDLFQLETEDVSAASGTNLVVEVIYTPT